MTEFILVRHGVTPWNREKRIQGQTDIGLAPEGEAMARSWVPHVKRLGVGAVVASDLQRAVRTAELAAQGLGLPVERAPGLREQDWGEWTGRTIADLRRDDRAGVEEQEARGWAFRPPSGESRLEVFARSQDALRRFAPKEARVFVVTHKGVLKCLLYDLLGMAFLPEEGDPIRDGCFHVVTLSTGGAFGLGAMNLKPEEVA